MSLIGYTRPCWELIREKNQKLKISRQTPFKFDLPFDTLCAAAPGEEVKEREEDGGH